MSAYKGATPAIQDLVGGRLDYVIDSVALLQPLAAAGKVHARATAEMRNQAQPTSIRCRSGELEQYLRAGEGF